MITPFRSKPLERLYERGDPRKLPTGMISRITLILSKLDVAIDETCLDLPSFRLHPLKGSRQGTWAVTVRANWRITFRFENGNACDVDFLDYHEELSMPMKDPAHPGLLIREELEFKRIPVTRAAADLHISRQHLHRIMRGEGSITAVLALRLESLIGGQADGWLRMQVNYDLAQARATLSNERQGSKPSPHLAPA